MQNSNRWMIITLLVLGTVAVVALLIKNAGHKECWFCTEQGRFERGLEFACSDDQELRKQALQYLSQAAESGIAEADIILAFAYSGAENAEALPVPPEAACLAGAISTNSTRAFDYLTKASDILKAEGKDAVSADLAMELVHMFSSPAFAKTDAGKAASEARFWLVAAADAGSVDATLNLASDAERNGAYTDALHWYQEAARLKPYPDFYLRIGDFYLYGMGTPVDYNKALEWYRKACDLASSPDIALGSEQQKHILTVCSVRQDIAKRKLARSGSKNPVEIKYALKGNAQKYMVMAEDSTGESPEFVRVGEAMVDSNGNISAEIAPEIELPEGIARKKDGFSSMNQAMEWLLGQWGAARYGKGLKFIYRLDGQG